jgi:hypothetical protein
LAKASYIAELKAKSEEGYANLNSKRGGVENETKTAIYHNVI